MEIRCHKCRARFQIPEEKIPQDRRVRLICPRCKNKLVLDLRNPVEDGIANAVETGGEPKLSQGHAGDTIAPGDASMEHFEEGEKLALVLEDGNHGRGSICQAVEHLGYKSVPAKNSREAIRKIRLYFFELVLLSDRFEGIDLIQSPVLQYLNHLPMSIRRKMFLSLIGDDFKTMDHMMAFAMSANLVVNRNDIERLEDILRRAISDNDKFYKVFTNTLAEVGKV